MRIFAPKETAEIETRAALDPAAARRLGQLGATVIVESGIGIRSDYPDRAYEEAGAEVATDRGEEMGRADLICRISKPSEAEIGQMKQGAIQLSFLDPFNEGALIEKLASRGVTAISLEMIPRSTLAQKMDAISSQANLAGYVAVMIAANRMNKILPMMTPAAGRIAPARVFVVGIGVAGLQAFATAKRLGARVTAFDVRPEALEQAESLGAKALRIDLGETGSADQGYAKELTPEQLEKQRLEQARVCAESDIVITTAKVFGRKPPILIQRDVIEGMQSGSVIVDLAAEAGGNVEGITPGEETETENGVKLIGLANFEGRVAHHASQMLASNFANMIEHFWDEEGKTFGLDLENDILKGCVITHGRAVVHERFAG